MKPRTLPSREWPWLADALLADPEVTERRMFGCGAYYKGELLMLMLTGEDEEPWNGVCVCTDRARQPALLDAFPELAPHPVLGKWLYLSLAHPDFERVALALAACVTAGDPRLGVPPGAKRRKSSPAALRVKKQKTR